MAKAALLAGGFLSAAWTLALTSAHAAQTMADNVVRCAELADDKARLRCFDQLVPDARKSEEERKAEIAAKAQADFGLNAAQINLKGKREHPNREQREHFTESENLRVEATIAALDISPYGTIFMLNNGQVWQTTSFGGLNTVPHIGQKVTVQSGTLGGYRLTLEGKTREVGVKRIK